MQTSDCFCRSIIELRPAPRSPRRTTFRISRSRIGSSETPRATQHISSSEIIARPDPYRPNRLRHEDKDEKRGKTQGTVRNIIDSREEGRDKEDRRRVLTSYNIRLAHLAHLICVLLLLLTRWGDRSPGLHAPVRIFRLLLSRL